MKGNIDKAVRAAEQELEDKEVLHLKNIIKNLLQRKKDKEQVRDDIEKEIKLLKQDVEDFKAGRLDKIKERHDADPETSKVAPIHITIINDNSRVVYPTQPWRWNYTVGWGPQYTYISNTAGGSSIGILGGSIATTGLAQSQQLMSATTSTNSIANLVYNCSGQTAAAFTQGTYTINGQVINLN